MRKWLIGILFILGSSQLALADFGLPPVDLRPGEFVKGELFSVKYVPGDQEISFFVVGKKKAGLQLKPKQIFLDVDGQKMPLEQSSTSRAFVYPHSVQSDATLTLEKEDGKTEKFRLKNP